MAAVVFETGRFMVKLAEETDGIIAQPTSSGPGRGV